MKPAGQDPEARPCARNGHSTALFAEECQSFLDNVMAGLGQIGAWDDRRSLSLNASLSGVSTLGFSQLAVYRV
jgi:hypothetical protein